ncbi:MAG: hypothetical protein HY553_16695 [Elusimicrobia bacterium]|nr:hypothetical protein [Elusimicrobiota bacterium]
MTPEQERAYELVRSYVGIYGTYRQNKEQMAYGATVLYLGAAAWIVSGTAFWTGFAPWQFAGLSLLFAVTAGGAFLFVGWQFQQRRRASDMVHACMRVTANWLRNGFGNDDVEPVLLASPGVFWSGTGLMWGPKAVADQLTERIRGRTSWWAPRDVTFAVMAVWTLAAASRIVFEWGDLSMLAPGDYWVLAGLALDMFGVVGVAAVGRLDRHAFFTSPADLTSRGRWFLRLSWLAVLLGFALQFIGQAGLVR